jgi:hypothetical protein
MPGLVQPMEIVKEGGKIIKKLLLYFMYEKILKKYVNKWVFKCQFRFKNQKSSKSRGHTRLYLTGKLISRTINLASS